jgi:hypothetical protein
MLESIGALYLMGWLLLGQSYTVVDLTASPSGLVLFLPLLAAMGLMATAVAETIIDRRTLLKRFVSIHPTPAKDIGS